jgi:thiol-disulfide isomerase/thioredoxin
MRFWRIFFSILFVTLLLTIAPKASERPAGEGFQGHWYATLKAAAGELPFELVLHKKGEGYSGELEDGHQRVKLQNFKLEGERLSFGIDDLRVRFELERRGEELTGTWKRIGTSSVKLPFTAGLLQPVSASSTRPASDFSGEWHCVTKGADGKETPITLIVRVDGKRIEGTGIDPTGDFGSMTGRIIGDRLVLTRFDGQTLSYVSAGIDGEQLQATATRSPSSQFTMAGVRKGAKLLLPDPLSVAKVSNGLSFSFPDPDGKTVVFPGDRFKGKAVIVNIMGTWCPNCHDEAPLLVELYNKYHRRGLEIVSLAFEAHATETEDLLAIKRYKSSRKIPYTMLYAGKTEGGGPAKRVAGLEQFGGYPTNVFIDRDGKIVSTHTGFWGPATGEKHKTVRHEFEETVKKLIGE